MTELEAIVRSGVSFQKGGERRRAAVVHEEIRNDDGSLRCPCSVLYIAWWVQEFFHDTMEDFLAWAADARVLTKEESQFGYREPVQ